MILTEVERLAITGSLLYASYITFTCPCEPLLGCHKAEFMLSVGLPLGYIAVKMAFTPQ
jgi:hypothetical protein